MAGGWGGQTKQKGHRTAAYCRGSGSAPSHETKPGQQHQLPAKEAVLIYHWKSTTPALTNILFLSFIRVSVFRPAKDERKTSEGDAAQLIGHCTNGAAHPPAPLCIPALAETATTVGTESISNQQGFLLEAHFLYQQAAACDTRRCATRSTVWFAKRLV